MIKHITVTGIHADVNKDISKYAKKKIAKLDAYMPRHARKSARAEIKLKEEKSKTRKQCTAEVIVHVPGEVITATETTVNMYAAIDIVEEKLKAQIRKYKTISNVHSGRKTGSVRAVLGKITRVRRPTTIQ